jgi:hypothetical protein
VVWGNICGEGDNTIIGIELAVQILAGLLFAIENSSNAIEETRASITVPVSWSSITQQTMFNQRDFC